MTSIFLTLIFITKHHNPVTSNTIFMVNFSIQKIITRSISTSCCRYGKKNFRKFELINKRGSKIFKKQQMENPDPRYPIDKRGVRDVGYNENNKFICISEMIPELIVPNLDGFKLKPYVTYKAEHIVTSEFTPKDLFEAIYAPKIAEDFKKSQLSETGESLNPSPEEKLTPTEARALASKPGADMFTAAPAPLGTLFSDEKR